MTNLPVKRPPIPQPPDSLLELDNLIIEKLDKGWSTFDFDVTKKRLNAVKKIVINRELKWSDPGLAIDDVITIVIGKQGADFEDHERRR